MSKKTAEFGWHNLEKKESGISNQTVSISKTSLIFFICLKSGWKAIVERRGPLKFKIIILTCVCRADSESRRVCALICTFWTCGGTKTCCSSFGRVSLQETPVSLRSWASESTTAGPPLQESINRSASMFDCNPASFMSSHILPILLHK